MITDNNYYFQIEENNREIEAMEVNFKYHQDTTESNFNLEWGAAFGQKVIIKIIVYDSYIAYLCNIRDH